MEVVLRDVNGGIVLLVEPGSLLAEKDRGKSLGSEDAKDDTSTAKNEEDPVNPSPLAGFFGDPSIVRQHWTSNFEIICCLTRQTKVQDKAPYYT